MKQVLFIFGLLCTILLLNLGKGFSTGTDALVHTEESWLIENDLASQQQEMQFVLSNELKECTCLTPRIQQLSNNNCEQRIVRASIKLMQGIQLKEHNTRWKVSESVSTYQSINYFSLLSRSGYHVYALRKIII